MITDIDGCLLNSEQKMYLGGFFKGLQNKGLRFDEIEPDPTRDASHSASDLDDLIAEEKIKKSKFPLDSFDQIRENAHSNKAPEKEDIFRFKWHGLFYVSPDNEGFMCRLRIPGGVVKTYQLREISAISRELTTGYIQITTRNNFQLRIIYPKDTPEVLRRIQSVGLHSRGAGADNIRNITASPTAGIDPYELIDVTPYYQDLAHCIISQKKFYDLPRKFNISFDGGGLITVLEDTNDIGLRAVNIAEPNSFGIPAGIYFKVLLGGVTGHKKFAENSYILVKPEDSVELVSSLVEVYIRDGNRTNRKKNRLVYLLDQIGFDEYISRAVEISGVKIFNIKGNSDNDILEIDRNLPAIPHPHVGVFPQKQDGLFYVGAGVPVGQMSPQQLESIADLADKYGSGEIRLTVWQNFIIPNVPQSKLKELETELSQLDFSAVPEPIRNGIVACTGNSYCKFASSNTKSHGIELGKILQSEIKISDPLNIHITGCPHSCAQHFIGDIGLLACSVKLENGEKVEGYHVFLGGGFGDNKKVGRHIFKSVPYSEIPSILTNILKRYEPESQKKVSFLEFTSTLSDDELRNIGNPGLTLKA